MRDTMAAADDRGAKFVLVENPVDPQAHAQLALGRLDMDIGGAGIDRFGDQPFDKAHDRRFAGAFLQAHHIGLGDVPGCHIEDFGGGISEGFGIKPQYAVFDLARRGDLEPDGLTEDKTQRLTDEGVAGVHGCDRCALIRLRKRQHMRVAQEGDAQLSKPDRRCGILFRRQQIETRDRCHIGGKILFFAKSKPDQNIRQAAAGARMSAPGALRIFGTQSSTLFQTREQAFFKAYIRRQFCERLHGRSPSAVMKQLDRKA